MWGARNAWLRASATASALSCIFIAPHLKVVQFEKWKPINGGKSCTYKFTK
jgi:hypothetical protein